jgi:hypothetical protein
MTGTPPEAPERLFQAESQQNADAWLLSCCHRVDRRVFTRPRPKADIITFARISLTGSKGDLVAHRSPGLLYIPVI